MLCFVSGCGLALFCLQVWSLATDAIDEIEIKTGQKEDGTAYSIFLFFRKMGQVIAAVAINGALLGMAYETDPLKVQSASTLQAMYIMASIIPAVLFGGMALCLWLWYPIDKKRLASLQIEKEAKLKEQVESNKITIVSAEEAK